MAEPVRPSAATVRIATGPIDPGAEIAALSAGRDDVGGVGSFVGTVRGGGGLVSLTLEHYPGMTEREMGAIAAEAGRRFGLLGCTLVHRVGTLVPGEPIVLVAAAARHRGAALEATAFLIDWLKTRAPFWKQERFADGRREWVAAREQDEARSAGWG